VKGPLTASASGWRGAVPAALASCLAAGCDPTVNVQGSFFPAWIICMAVAGVVTAVLRQLFASIRIEPHMGPVLLVYPSLWVLVTMLTWLAFYRT
jgi:hypothetical protein